MSTNLQETHQAQSPSYRLPSGAVVGNFRLGAELGSGSMSTVYAASELSSDRRGALKVTPVRTHAELARFRRSVAVRAGLEHPSILPVWAHGVRPRLAYVVTPRLEPETLESKIDRAQGHSFDRVARWLAPLASALECLHERGWVHRDFKPGNVLFRRSGLPVLGDYGLVKRHLPVLAQAEAPESEEETRRGAICGTPNYMSAERLEGADASPADDAYAFSLTLVELLTGRLPAAAAGQSIFALAKSRSARPGLPSLNCPKGVQTLVQRGLSPDPEERPRLKEFEVLLS